ncbi:hypothetical protein CNECB9_3760102 [Cupriavidus necator]|uniref:Integrase catalytic domain-containing protein n=1 Tax=Cupriavidus necator TaxID=106590 RepID=A0A1K0JDV6_CUPNE|nr:hypothetical protein CNECB9_3760102 [Cupriavidus necator]
MLFVAVDDHARIAFTAMRPDEKKESAVQFLLDAVAYYASLGETVRRLLTDNGAPFRSREFARACQALGIRHKVHPRLPPANQRQGRTLHPIGLARVGLCLDVSELPGSRPSPNQLAVITTTGIGRIAALAALRLCPDFQRREITS